KVELNADSTSLEMRLNPENLGRVSINIISKAGVMTAQINTENRQAKEAIESSLQILKENIEAKGIKVEAVEVRISDFNMTDSRNSESEASNGRSEGNRNSRRNNSLFANGTDATDEIQAEETILNPESTVSFRA
ncbi:MAG: flagellar hook-length control protein FliK, partial [Lachnospiraceae bacterium]|nr:flagellar hook-length control protein FliK [Lachnospiraceae bacterium]